MATKSTEPMERTWVSVKGGVKLDHQSGEKIDHFLVE